MVLASVLTPLLALAGMGAIVALAPARLAIGVAVALVVGVGVAVHRYRESSRGHPLPETAAPELHAIVGRLCALADLSKPTLVRTPEAQPNAWVVGVRPRTTRLYVTVGLLELLEPEELTAVIAHELSHLAHRDAAVMTAVGGPSAALVAGGRMGFSNGGLWQFWIPAGLAWLLGSLTALGTNSLSRHRELAADEGAAALTGRPAALVSALRRMSGSLALVPREDLRSVAARDAFHVLPTGDEGSGAWRGLMATHPPLETRIARLERLEQRLHTPDR